MANPVFVSRAVLFVAALGLPDCHRGPEQFVGGMADSGLEQTAGHGCHQEGGTAAQPDRNVGAGRGAGRRHTG